jgi:GntR family transcriptional regulator
MPDALPEPQHGVPLAGPLYKEVKRLLMAALTRGEWKPGEAIPAERRLSERCGTSIGTVRKAIDELVAENILIRQQGRGTFVASHNRDRMLFYFFHIVPEHGPKQYPDVELLSFARTKADRAAADLLRMEAGEPAFRIRNRLLLSGTPIIVDDITLPATLFPGLTERQFRGRPSTIYNLYQEAFGISIVRTSERLRATVADAETAALLSIARNAPLLKIRRVALSYNETPIELRVSLVDTTRFEYFAEIGKPP